MSPASDYKASLIPHVRDRGDAEKALSSMDGEWLGSRAMGRGWVNLADSPRICCHPCKLSESMLGLEEDLYNTLALHATVVVQATWAVNFSMRLSSFKEDCLCYWRIGPHAPGKYQHLSWTVIRVSQHRPNILSHSIQPHNVQAKDIKAHTFQAHLSRS